MDRIPASERTRERLKALMEGHESARHRVDHGTICGRTCANSGHYKPLCACVDRTFVNPNSSRRRPGRARIFLLGMPPETRIRRRAPVDPGHESDQAAPGYGAMRHVLAQP